jgi:hypothetical protein
MKMKKIKIRILCLLWVGMMSSCANLDIPPMNVIGDEELLASESGMKLYLAHLYAKMPFDDFKWSPHSQYFYDYLVSLGTSSGEALSMIGCERELTGEGWRTNGAYWTGAFGPLREANYLIEALPNYKSKHLESNYNHYLGEAYFARAFIHYALAKRYGGIPLVTRVLKYPDQSVEELEIPRSTEEETWNQILADFDMAASLLQPTSPVRGYSNKYVALGFKSEAMLYAGTVAKYNEYTGFGTKTNVRVVGFDANTAAAASKKYLLEAWKAAREVMKSRKYELYGANATDPAVKYQNMIDMFFNVSSVECMYAREYQYPYSVHGFDAYSLMFQWGGYGQFSFPTLEQVELYDGFPKNPDGSIKVFDKVGADGKPTAESRYILYDKLSGFFANAEPRLKAFILLPGEVFKGEINSLYTGIFTGNVTDGIAPLMTRNGVVDYSWKTNGVNYNQQDAFRGTGKFSGQALFIDASPTVNTQIDLPNHIHPVFGTPADRVNASGLNGPFVNSNGNTTGFGIRKYLNPNMPRANVAEGQSSQAFIVLRYAEILLNAAEAAAELKLAGETNPEGENGMQIAFDAIQAIRSRAGANLLTSGTELEGVTGLDIIRKERRKELAFEWKYIWDIRRWRIQDKEVINGFKKSDGTVYRGLYPFYSTQANKWLFDARTDKQNRNFSFASNNYYLPIPAGEVGKSPLLDQQPDK